MNISTFINEYNSAEDIYNFCKSHIVNTYVPYEQKIADCEAIINATLYREIDGYRVYKPNTPARMVNMKLIMITRYTDIEVDYEHTLDSYNALEEYNLVDKLIYICIPEEERARYKEIQNMIENDVATEHSVSGLIENKLKMWTDAFMESATEIAQNPEIVKLIKK